MSERRRLSDYKKWNRKTRKIRKWQERLIEARGVCMCQATRPRRCLFAHFACFAVPFSD